MSNKQLFSYTPRKELLKQIEELQLKLEELTGKKEIKSQKSNEVQPTEKEEAINKFIITSLKTIK